MLFTGVRLLAMRSAYAGRGFVLPAAALRAFWRAEQRSSSDKVLGSRGRQGRGGAGCHV